MSFRKKYFVLLLLLMALLLSVFNLTLFFPVDGYLFGSLRRTAVVANAAAVLFCFLFYYALDRNVLARIRDIAKKAAAVLPDETQKRFKGELDRINGGIDYLLERLEISRHFLIVSEYVKDLVVKVDMEGNLLYVSPSHKSVLGYAIDDVYRRKNIFFIHPDDIILVEEANRALVEKGEGRRLEIRFRHADGHYIWVETLPTLIFNERQEPVALVVCSRDITDRKQMEEQLRYYSLYDVLTGIYNRNYFEHEMLRLQNSRSKPVGVILCDIDGLKIINDSLGHDMGDRMLRTAADLLKSCFRQEDIIARIGGDEFAVLLPNCSTEILQQAVRRIREAVDGHNRRRDALYLSMSVGSAMGDETTDVKDTFKLADNDMYREKLHRSIREPDAATGLLLRTLGKRDYVDDGHAERLIVLVDKMAVALNLPGATLEKLRLLAKFHDIGKLGIPGGILFKKAPLTEQEWQQVRQHCEIGHRIALSIPALAPIADWILKHHEWWNGQGYPFGLKGEEIPLECRIFSIADAYENMTGNRVYRRALSYEQAAAELRACAGKQFAPELTEIFLSLFEEQKDACWKETS